MADLLIIAPEGELDLHAARELKPVLDGAAEAEHPLLVIDLSDVSFIDSVGLGSIVQAHQRLRRQGRAVRVVAPKGSAAAVLMDLSGLRPVLTICASRAEAVAG
jgi:anti-anti-sigma factor